MLSKSSGRSYIYNQHGGIISEVTVDADESVVFSRQQDVTDLLEYCHYRREYIPVNKKSAFRPIAEIPNTVYAKALIEGWAKDPDAWKKWCRDPDNKAFRTSNMRI